MKRLPTELSKNNQMREFDLSNFFRIFKHKFKNKKIMIKKSLTKFPFTNKFETLKQMYKSKNFDIKLFDEISTNMIVILGEYTVRGIEEIERVPVEKWKDRVWNLIENAGLLPEYKEEDKDIFVEVVDNWYGED
jgi:hypothetical protein